MNDENKQHAIKQVLDRIGYYENVEYPEFYPFIKESKRLFREVVTQDPRNATAWKAFIDNDYLIDPEGCNPCIPWSFGLRGGVGEGQKKIAKEAFMHCKNDPAIRLWNCFVSPENAVLPDTMGQLEFYDKTIGVKIKRSESGWHLCPISPVDLELIKSKYTVTKDNYLIINDRNIDNATKNKIVSMLYQFKYYHFKLCRDLKRIE